MGVWGPGIFDNDLALDVRTGFRELVAAGFDPEAASRRVIQVCELGAEPASRPGWLALAVTQWETGRVTAEVQASGLAAIDADELTAWEESGLGAQRRRVLAATLDKLQRPPRPPTNIKPPTVAKSPYMAGDVVAYRLRSGVSVAIWAMRNHSHHGLAFTDVNTYFQLSGFWPTQLPSLEDVVATEPPQIQDDGGGHAYVLEFTLQLPQYAVGPEWRTIGRRTFPSEREVGDYRLISLRSRASAAAAFDDYMTYCYEHRKRV